MRIFAWILVFTWLAVPMRAQDTTAITFSEEAVQLRDQRFVDRFENVFMTKVPTRKIFKLGYTATAYKGIGLTAAFEYKIFPFMSLEAGIYSRAAREGDGIYSETFFRQLSGENLFASAGTRWYPNMMRRIARQQSANNFTGSYVSLLYERSLGAIQYGYVRDHFSLTYGLQSRFLRNGFLDFSLGLYYLRPYVEWYPVGKPVTKNFELSNLVFASRSLIGLAFGDWKKTSTGPLCDVLHCDYLVRQHLKIRLPEVNIGLKNQSFRVEAGYERKVGRSPFSVNLAVRNATERSSPYYENDVLNGRTEVEGQLRLYYLQKSQIRKGKASDNLSGLYVGARLGYRWEYYHTPRGKYSDQNQLIGIAAGYQQRLFNRLYFDSAIGYTAVGYVGNVFKVRFGEANARAGVGFAF